MAERISRGQLKFGVPAIALRDALRFVGHHYAGSGLFAHRLKITDEEANRLVSELVDAGWLKGVEWKGNFSGWYEVTQIGHAFTHARATRPLRRAKAEQLLAGAIEAAKKINADGTMPNYVGELYVFGSFLGEAPEIGDLDLGLKIEQRLGRMSSDDWVKWSRDYGYENSSARTYLQVLFYSEEAVMRLVKQRSPYVSIHGIGDLDRIGAERRLVFKAGRVAAPKRLPRSARQQAPEEY